jgi:prevent-host-death family protein
MKSVSIRELHERTGDLVRQAARHGEIVITDHGQPVAKIITHQELPETPYFSRRKLNPDFRAIMHKLRGGVDSTSTISDDREDRA